MKKAVLALVVVLLVVVLGGPFLAGNKARQTLDNMVTFLNNQPGYSAQWLEYQEGWLTTNARLNVAMTMAAMPDDAAPDSPNPEVDFDIVINHGPIVLTDGFKLAWASGQVVLGEAVDGWLREKLVIENDAPLCTSDFTISLSGAVAFSDQCQAAAIAMEDGEFRFDSYQGEGSYESNGLLEYQGVLPAGRFESGDGFMDMGAVQIAMTLDFGRVYNGTLVPGDFSLSLLSLQGDSNEEDAFSLSDLNMKSILRFNDDNTMSDGTMEMSLKGASGADVSLTDVRFVMGFERISLAFWDNYTKKAQEMAEAGDMSALGSEMLGIVMTDLLPAGPSISIPELRFTTNEGSMNLSADLNVSPDAAQSADPMSIIQHISLQLDAVADKALALSLSEQSTRKELQSAQFEGGELIDNGQLEAQSAEMAAMKLNMLVVQGMLVEDGERYKASFSFKDGTAVLNGQPIPLPF